MYQVLSSLAAAVFLALAAILCRSGFALILLSLACACAWVEHITGLSYQWQARAMSTGLGLYALALVFTTYAWYDQA